MGLSIGIVGLPNVGKSTTFNALSQTQSAQVANYPFCTIEPNRAIVPVPDARLAELAKIVNPERIQHSVVEFVDIAGLVRGASRGEGLGNQFLGNIKEVDVILHIVRCFDDENITHVEGGVDPVRDVEIIDLELLLADLQSLEKRIARLEKQSKSDKTASAMLHMALQLQKHLEAGEAIRTFEDREHESFKELDRELRFLSNKEVIFGANVKEDELLEDNLHVKNLKDFVSKSGCPVIKFCSKLEEEMVGMSEEEKREFLQSLGCAMSGLEQITQEGFRKLGLISYFTAGVKEVRSWTIRQGDRASVAAGVIHKDFEKGFIRAETIAYEDFVRYGGEAKAKEAGAMRSEGKEYIICDGDVMHFRFNV